MRKLEGRRTSSRRITINSPHSDYIARIRTRTTQRPRRRTVEVSLDRLPLTNLPLDCREEPTEDSHRRMDVVRTTPRRTDLDRLRSTPLPRSSFKTVSRRMLDSRKSCIRYETSSTERLAAERIMRGREHYRRFRRCRGATLAVPTRRRPPTSPNPAPLPGPVTTLLLPRREPLRNSRRGTFRRRVDRTTRSLRSSTPHRSRRKEEDQESVAWE